MVSSAPLTLLRPGILVSLIFLTALMAKAGDLEKLLSWSASGTNQGRALRDKAGEAEKGVPVSRVVTNRSDPRVQYTISLGSDTQYITLEKDRQREPSASEILRDSQIMGRLVSFPKHEATHFSIFQKDIPRLIGDFEKFLKCCEVAEKEKLTDVKKELDSIPWPDSDSLPGGSPMLVLTFTSDENGLTHQSVA